MKVNSSFGEKTTYGGFGKNICFLTSTVFKHMAIPSQNRFSDITDYSYGLNCNGIKEHRNSIPFEDISNRAA